MKSIKSIIEGSDKLAPARQRDLEKAKAMPDATVIHGLRLYTMADLMAQEFPDTLWVVDGLIPEGITVLSAAPASFKTWLLLDIATSVASGDPLFDHFVTEQSGVLIIDEENNARLLQQRLNLLDVDNELPIYFLIEQNFKLEDQQIDRVIELCEEKDIGLITFDSLVRIHLANENDASAMAQVFSRIRRFTKSGINVLITHHHRKGKSDSPSQDMRGSSDILAAVDCHISLSRDGKRLVFTQTKSRYSEELDPVEIEVESSGSNLKFIYIGTTKPSESKKAQTTKAIKVILDEVAEINQTDLMTKLDEVGFKVNKKTLRSYLNDMYADESINKRQGKGSELLYTLNR